MIIPELKARLKDLGWPVSGNKDVLIERLGWAELLQSFEVFSDKPEVVQNTVWFQDLIKTGPIEKEYLKLPGYKLPKVLLKLSIQPEWNQAKNLGKIL